ncbi:MAG: hypothetical protein ACTSPW_20375, partial [Promethearchaeota archaeon]
GKEDGIADFTDLLITASYPNYELVIDQCYIIKQGPATDPNFEFESERIWRYTESSEYTSDTMPADDKYPFIVPNTIFGGENWQEYAEISDENYNYYSIGINNSHQLFYNSTGGYLYWNTNFDSTQMLRKNPDGSIDWWNSAELPSIIEPNTKLTLKYCLRDSWKKPIFLNYENIDVFSLAVFYDYDYTLIPRFEENYGEIIENDPYSKAEYEVKQYYSMEFSVPYNTNNKEKNNYTLNIDLPYSLNEDYKDFKIFDIIGIYPDFSKESILLYPNISFVLNLEAKTLTLIDLSISDNFSFDNYETISVQFQYSYGPASSLTTIELLDQFENNYLGKYEDTFNDYISFSFQYYSPSGEYLFFEDSESITSDYTIFNTSSFIRNDILDPNGDFINDYFGSSFFNYFELYPDFSDIIYSCDFNGDGKRDYKELIDLDRNGIPEFTRFGEGEDNGSIIWYVMIMDYELKETYIDKGRENERSTRWIDLKESDFGSAPSFWDINIESFKEDVDFEDFLASDYAEFIADNILGLIFCLWVPDMDYWGRKYYSEKIDVKYTKNSRLLSVIVDTEKDGFYDKQVVYEKESTVAEYSIVSHEKILVAAKKNKMAADFADIVNIEKYFKPLREDKIFNDDLTEDDLDAGRCDSLVRKSYRKFEREIKRTYKEESINEKVSVLDWSNGGIEEMRIYRDLYDTDSPAYNEYITVENVLSSSNIYLDDIPGLSEFNPTDSKWDIETWGPDDVPVKFDSLTIVRDSYTE